jgi:hypothetical protein
MSIEISKTSIAIRQIRSKNRVKKNIISQQKPIPVAADDKRPEYNLAFEILMKIKDEISHNKKIINNNSLVSTYPKTVVPLSHRAKSSSLASTQQRFLAGATFER